MQFKLGDVVRLKSGGPKMTVAEVTNDGYIDCEWFADEGPTYGWLFEPEMLEFVVDEDGFYDADDTKYDGAEAKWMNGDKLSPEEWDVFAAGNDEYHDALLDPGHPYWRDRGH